MLKKTTGLAFHQMRYLVKAYFGPQGLMMENPHEGTQTWDRLWRTAPLTATHVVVLRGANDYLVADLFSSKETADAWVRPPPAREWLHFKDYNAAMMAAAMMAARGCNREKFSLFARDIWIIAKMASRADIRAAEVYTKSLRMTESDV